MSSFSLVAPDTTDVRARELLATVKAKIGIIPNMTRALARAPRPSMPTCR